VSDYHTNSDNDGDNDDDHSASMDAHLLNVAIHTYLNSYFNDLFTGNSTMNLLLVFRDMSKDAVQGLIQEIASALCIKFNVDGRLLQDVVHGFYEIIGMFATFIDLLYCWWR
jgi:hypothetical protein